MISHQDVVALFPGFYPAIVTHTERGGLGTWSGEAWAGRSGNMECGESWEHGAGRPGNMERGGLGTRSGEAWEHGVWGGLGTWSVGRPGNMKCGEVWEWGWRCCTSGTMICRIIATLVTRVPPVSAIFHTLSLFPPLSITNVIPSFTSLAVRETRNKAMQ